MILPKIPHDLKCGLDRLRELLDSGADLKPHTAELRRLLSDGYYLILVASRRNDKYFAAIDETAIDESRQLQERREYNTHRD